MTSRIKRGLKNLGLSVLAASVISTGCANTYVSKYDHLENRVNSEVIENFDGNRVGLDILADNVTYIGNNAFRISGYSESNGEQISIYEDVRNSNKNLLDDVKDDLESVMDINRASPANHPMKTVYVTGIFDQREFNNDILELETININGDLYFTDPINKSRLYVNDGHEFWNDSWWRWYSNVHYPANLKPWWDPNVRGVMLHDYNNFHAKDSDEDGISDWSERMRGTNPYNWDSDFDGLSDLTELWVGTNPLNPDSDFDGYLDGHDPFPLWHSRNHWNHNHLHWHNWWDVHYKQMDRRHFPISKERRNIPSKVWKEKKDHREYRKKLHHEEKSLKDRLGIKKEDGRKYVPKKEEIGIKRDITRDYVPRKDNTIKKDNSVRKNNPRVIKKDKPLVIEKDKPRVIKKDKPVREIKKDKPAKRNDSSKRKESVSKSNRGSTSKRKTR